MAISLEQSPHLPSPRLFQRKETTLPFPTTHITCIAKLTELQQCLICTSAGAAGLHAGGGDLGAEGVTQQEAQCPHRQAPDTGKQSSGSDQGLHHQAIPQRKGGIFLSFYLFSLDTAETVEEARCTFQRCLLPQSFQHLCIIHALHRQYPSPAAGQLLVT